MIHCTDIYLKLIKLIHQIYFILFFKYFRYFSFKRKKGKALKFKFQQFSIIIYKQY